MSKFLKATRTMNGASVSHLCWVEGDEYPIAGVLTDDEVSRECWTANGKYWLNDQRSIDDRDLDPASIPAEAPAAQPPRSNLPKAPEQRKALPITTGVLDYFPDALLAVAACSKAGNDQHNPGQPLHWSRGKSTDHADCLVRHLMERGTIDTDGIRHSAKVAWRALALLQLEIEAAREGEASDE